MTSFILTFSPHPEKILGRRWIKMIQTLDQRVAGFQELGIQTVLVTPFDRKFLNLTRREFVYKVLLNPIHAREVIVGENFRFGKGRSGDIRFLKQMGEHCGFIVHSIPPVIKGGRVVSSSRIRTLLEEGQMEKARNLIGRPYEIEGRVVKGSSRGKILGFPTANIETENEIAPLGVFITQTQTEGRTFCSLTNLGGRPTFAEDKLRIETFLLDFEGKLYGKKVRIRFLRKLRDEKKFASPLALAKQIRRDIEEAKTFLGRK